VLKSHSACRNQTLFVEKSHVCVAIALILVKITLVCVEIKLECSENLACRSNACDFHTQTCYFHTFVCRGFVLLVLKPSRGRVFVLFSGFCPKFSLKPREKLENLQKSINLLFKEILQKNLHDFFSQFF
jgi:hypothetical protein